MGFILIKGTFHVIGYSPDGDLIRFKANDEKNWVKLNGNVKLNVRKHAQLRFQAIDTLETHYKKQHQPDEYALGAMNMLLDTLSITNVQWNQKRTKITSANDATEGYILCREAERYGRPIAFVFAGKTEYNDGENIFLDKEWIKESINYKTILKGMAYPTFYLGLFHDLRQVFIDATKEARKNGIGLFALDKTQTGFIVDTLDSITENQVILPKLFRRVITHLLEFDNLENFKDELQRKRERVLIINKAHDTFFDSIIEIQENEVKLKEYIENLMFFG